MAPAVEKEYTLTYGSQEIGGTSDWEIDRGLKVSRKYGVTVLEFDALYASLAADEASDFIAACNAFEQAMNRPLQRLQLELSGESWLDLNPDSSVNTGFNAKSEAALVGSRDDTARSRRYRCRIEVQTPADLSGRDGRLDSEVEIKFGGARVAQVVITGTYTALGSNDATAQYAAAVEDYVDPILAALTQTFPAAAYPDDEEHKADAEDKVLTFRREYWAILHPESAAGTDDPALAKPVLKINRIKTGPGDAVLDGRRAERLIRFEVDFTAEVNADLSTDPKSKWDDDLRDHTVSRMIEIFGLAGVALVDEAVSVGDSRNTLDVRMVLLGASSDLIEAEEEVQVAADLGKLVVEGWGPKIDSAYEFDVPGRTVMRVQTRVTEIDGAGARGQGRAAIRNGVHLSRTPTVKRFTIGLDAYTLRLVETTIVDVYRIISKIEPGASPGPSSSGGSTVAREGDDSAQSIFDSLEASRAAGRANIRRSIARTRFQALVGF